MPPNPHEISFNFVENDSYALGSLTDRGTGRRYSTVVDKTTGLPVALLGSGGPGSRKIEVRPVSRGSGSSTRTNSIIRLLNDPFG